MPLRPYQESALHDVADHFTAGVRSVCLVVPTGGGKSILATSWLTGDSLIKGAPRRHSETGLFLVHRDQLRQQAFEHLERVLPGDIGMIGPGTNPNPEGRIQVATIQTLLARNERPAVKRIVLDECFPAGTLVDGYRIETIKPGDLVSCWDHTHDRMTQARVTRTFCRQPHTLVTVHLAGGDSVSCTAEHPIFTRRGYVAAVTLTGDDEVLHGSDLRGLRRNVPATPSRLEDHDSTLRQERVLGGLECTPTQDPDDALLRMRHHRRGEGQNRLGESTARSGLLLDRASERPPRPSARGERDAHQPEVCLGSNARTQPYAESGSAREGIKHTSSDRTSAEDPRRKWARPNGAAADAPGSPGVRLGRGTSNPCQATPPDVANLPEDRRGKSRTNDRGRSGRHLPLITEGEGSGRAENRLPKWTRVDRVEIHEPDRQNGFGDRCPSDLVYNLEVEQHHNYFANGILVHNCHHYIADNWTTLLSAYPDAKLLGLTATPERKDGRPLGDIFQRLVVGARYPELVADGHLVSCRAFAPPEAVDRGIANDPVAMYQRYGEGGPGFLFADSIPNAEMWAERFSAAGIPAVAVHQNTPARDRARILDAFAAGQIRILTNVYLFTEGTDIPAARVCILARPMTHASMYLQCVGRVLRPAPGKRDAILIDLCGSVLEHGLPTEDRQYSLDGRAIRRTTESVRQCPQCGAVQEGTPARCDLCGYEFPTSTTTAPLPPRIYDMELREVYAGQQTPVPAVRREFDRLVSVALERDYSLGWVVKQFTQLFGSAPTRWLAELPVEVRKREFDRLTALGAERGYKPGFASARYRELTGAWPPWSWRQPTRETSSNTLEGADVPF